MRPDLNKLLCERERVGSTDKYKNYRRLKKFNPAPGDEGENLPFREGTKFRYGYNGRSFNENLSPLRGAIRANLGKRWDTFYSELCKNFDKRSVINQHILQHLFQYVERELYIEDGELWVRAARYTSSGDQKLRDSTYTEYYVDPRDGIMKKNKWYGGDKARKDRDAAEARAKEHAVTRWIDDDTVLRKIEDTWFVFDLKDIPKAYYTYSKPSDKDVFTTGWRKGSRVRTWEQLSEHDRKRFGTKTLVGPSVRDVFSDTYLNYADHFRQKRYHTNKRTASHKMLKQAGIV